MAIDVTPGPAPGQVFSRGYRRSAADASAGTAGSRTLPDGREKTQEARPPIAPLKPADVNLSAHSIRVLHTKMGKPQTRRFHPSATDALGRWLDVRRQLGLNGRHPLFSTLKGEPLRENYVRAMLGRLAAKAEVTKRVHPHAFRHYADGWVMCPAVTFGLAAAAEPVLPSA